MRPKKLCHTETMRSEFWKITRIVKFSRYCVVLNYSFCHSGKALIKLSYYNTQYMYLKCIGKTTKEHTFFLESYDSSKLSYSSQYA